MFQERQDREAEAENDLSPNLRLGCQAEVPRLILIDRLSGKQGCGGGGGGCDGMDRSIETNHLEELGFL